jgi:glucan phosphoethanolaminetransferase (alkaline phosphatase superfamily)
VRVLRETLVARRGATALADVSEAAQVMEVDMDLVLLVFGIALIGLLVWVITTYIPMEPIFKTIIYIVVGVALLFFLIRHFASNVPNVLH